MSAKVSESTSGMVKLSAQLNSTRGLILIRKVLVRVCFGWIVLLSSACFRAITGSRSKFCQDGRHFMNLNSQIALIHWV
jgi:hypothetical protein